jgi:hypothetical protein
VLQTCSSILHQQSIYCLISGSASFGSRKSSISFGLGLVIGLFISYFFYGLIALPLRMNKQEKSPAKDTQGEIFTFILYDHPVSRRYLEGVLAFNRPQSSTTKPWNYFLTKIK